MESVYSAVRTESLYKTDKFRLQRFKVPKSGQEFANHSNVELHPICHLLALLGARYILHVSRLSVKVTSLCIFITKNVQITNKPEKETPTA